jgi:hypothetical protein
MYRWELHGLKMYVGLMLDIFLNSFADVWVFVISGRKQEDSCIVAQFVYSPLRTELKEIQ